MSRVKRLLLLATLVAVVLPGPTSAAGTSCRNKVFNDWYRDGKIASTYPLGCYRDALKHIPGDAGIYSSLSDDIRSALRAATRRSHGLSVPRQVGHGFSAVGAGNVKGTLASIRATSRPHDPVPGGTVAGGTSLADSASSAPLPILVIGGVALALAAAGAIGLGVRHARSRR
jgi:hypothetical protein